MPSVINANIISSEIDFSDKPIFYTQPSSTSSKDSTINDIKESNRRRQQWCDPDDEFSVPIHTEFPLISKEPLDISSFLLNHRTMNRSIEIMTPPPVTHEEGSSSSSSSSTFYPMIPDGPIYIHHRSTMTESPLASVVSCPHVNCYEHSRRSYSIARPSACQKNHLLSDDHNGHQDNSYSTTKPHAFTTTKGSSMSGSTNNNRCTSQQKHSFLESHISSIDQWLSSKTGPL